MGSGLENQNLCMLWFLFCTLGVCVATVAYVQWWSNIPRLQPVVAVHPPMASHHIVEWPFQEEDCSARGTSQKECAVSWLPVSGEFCNLWDAGCRSSSSGRMRHWVPALAWGTSKNLVSPSLPFSLSALSQGGQWSPGYKSDPLFPKWMGLVFPGPEIHYRPISVYGHRSWCPGSCLPFHLWHRRPSWQWQNGQQCWVTSLPDTNTLNEFCVSFLFANTVCWVVLLI